MDSSSKDINKSFIQMSNFVYLWSGRGEGEGMGRKELGWREIGTLLKVSTVKS